MSRISIALGIFTNGELAAHTATNYPSISGLVSRSLDDTAIISIVELVAVLTLYPALASTEPILYSFVASAMLVNFLNATLHAFYTLTW